MLQRIYINNYKTLVNFQTDFQSINLFLGDNGSGKSTVFDVLMKLRQLIIGKNAVEDLFLPNTLTRWQMAPIQTFELAFKVPDGIYVYHLQIDHDRENRKLRIKQERLSFNQQILLDFELGNVKLYREDGGMKTEFPSDWSRSVVGALPERNDNKLLTAFKHMMERLLILHPITVPALMLSKSFGAVRTPEFYAQNFVAWYHDFALKGRFTTNLTGDLEAVLPGFDSLSLTQRGQEEHVLTAHFRTENAKASFSFDELSDGQRMLIILYTLLNLPGLPDYEPLIICLDEPENFVTLREIDPWLYTIFDKCQEGAFQLFLISHHPKVIDYLLMPDNDKPYSYWFERDGGLSPTRIQAVSGRKSDLPASELIARGWFDAKDGN